MSTEHPAAYDQEDTCLEQPQASGMDSVSGSESRSLSPGSSSCSSRAASSDASGYEFSFQVFEVTAEEAEALFDATASFVHERADQVFGIGPGPIKDEGDESRV